MASRESRRSRGAASKPNAAQSYAHPEAESLLRPDVGTQAQFRNNPFEAGEHRQIAVKVIDDRGNELLVVKPLPRAGR